MAMELLEGDDLRALIERGRDIPLADRVRILAQICEGLGLRALARRRAPRHQARQHPGHRRRAR